MPKQVEGAVEAERLQVSATSAGLDYQIQGMATDRWSGGAHLWVKAVAPGDFIELRVPAPAPGRYRVSLVLTRSRDYARLGVSLDGKRVVEEVDTFNPDGVALMPELDLGTHEIGDLAILRLETVGHNEDSVAPHYYFGLDCVVLRPAQE
jgi:hypothetical protein